ncbi:hypothetical protein GCM10027258_41300 [Amycolatopsis stemonae]
MVNPWAVIIAAASPRLADGDRANVGVLMMSRARMAGAPFPSGVPTISLHRAVAQGPKSPACPPTDTRLGSKASSAKREFR